MGNHALRPRVLKWIDKEDEKDSKKAPLAKLIPIQDTIKFDYQI
jgi:hypothetical protein